MFCFFVVYHSLERIAGDGGIAAFERGLSTVPAEQQSALLQLYLSHILGKLKAAEPSAAQSVREVW